MTCHYTPARALFEQWQKDPEYRAEYDALSAEFAWQRFASVWDAIEDTPTEAENMRLRSALMLALERHIKSEGLSKVETARILGVTQPRVSDLMRGKIDLFSLDTLINMAAAAGLQIEMSITPKAAMTV